MINVGANKYSLYSGNNRVKIKSTLPTGYIECNWIVAKTDCYINTGVYPTSSHSIEVEARYYEYSSAGYQSLFGSRENNNSAFEMSDANKMTELMVQYSTNSGISRVIYNIPINRADRCRWRKYGLFKNVAKIDGATVYTFATPTGNTAFPNPIELLCIRNGNTHIDYGHYYIKSCKIWDGNNALIRDYVPAYQVSTEKYGLYDLINNTFVTSGNSNELEGSIKTHILPSGYTEIDYIRFNGSTYIELSESFNQTDAVEVEWKWNDIATKQQRIFSSTPSGTAMLLYINGSGGMSFNYGAASNWVVLVASGADFAQSWCKIDGYNKTLTGRIHATNVSKDLSSYTEVTDAQTLVIGTRENKAMSSKMDLFRFKKWENNILVREFVPCKNSNGVYGFYDIIKNEFVTATVGTLQGGYIKD